MVGARNKSLHHFVAVLFETLTKNLYIYVYHCSPKRIYCLSVLWFILFSLLVDKIRFDRRLLAPSYNCIRWISSLESRTELDKPFQFVPCAAFAWSLLLPTFTLTMPCKCCVEMSLIMTYICMSHLMLLCPRTIIER